MSGNEIFSRIFSLIDKKILLNKDVIKTKNLLE